MAMGLASSSRHTHHKGRPRVSERGANILRLIAVGAALALLIGVLGYVTVVYGPPGDLAEVYGVP
jgi:hypothetical protein